jgi:hypothetical protein
VYGDGSRVHRGFTAAVKTELWDRWKRGESLKEIGRAFGKPSWSMYCLVAPHGGIRPAQRRRSRLALTLAEREVILWAALHLIDSDRRILVSISQNPEDTIKWYAEVRLRDPEGAPGWIEARNTVKAGNFALFCAGTNSPCRA